PSLTIIDTATSGGKTTPYNAEIFPSKTKLLQSIIVRAPIDISC
ncbi:MAG: hypothetical protein ACI9WS_002844, partial [Paraglaciecola psychrophila]